MITNMLSIFRVHYIRRFLYALNKNKCNIFDASTQMLNDALNYAVIHNHTMVIGFYNNQYILKSTLPPEDVNTIPLFSNNSSRALLIHAIQWNPIGGQEFIIKAYLEYHNNYNLLLPQKDNTLYFAHPLLPYYMSDLCIIFSPHSYDLIGVNVYSSILQTPFPESVYYLSLKNDPITIHTDRIMLAACDYGERIPCYGEYRCVCTEFTVNPDNTLHKYAIPQKYLV